MTLPSKSKKLCNKEMNSIENAVKDVDIRAVHPDKMEEWAEHLVRKLKSEDN